ncbi:hypothetical protein JXA31_00320 [Candidatus Bathyarchaeota archaeon]|nr:hypothetical protein [Candidatus Bathyarchaeota archaeon]
MIFFERTARTKADSTIAKSTTPKVKRGLLKAGSEWKTTVEGRPAKQAAKKMPANTAPSGLQRLETSAFPAFKHILHGSSMCL